MAISRSSTLPVLTRSPSCSYSLVTHARSPRIAAAVGMEVCQILLSKPDLDSARAMRDVGAMLAAALERGLLPLVKRTDTTDPKSELDNDQIAVAVAALEEGVATPDFRVNCGGGATFYATRVRITPLSDDVRSEHPAG